MPCKCRNCDGSRQERGQAILKVKKQLIKPFFNDISNKILNEINGDVE